MNDEEFFKKYVKVVQELSYGESLRRAARLGGFSLGIAQKVKRLTMMDV
jgi:hypothetical protein